MFRLTVLLCASLSASLALSGCQRASAVQDPSGGDPGRGKLLVTKEGCGSCHLIPGIAGANGLAGPPLTHFGQRTIVAGVLPNTPENLVRWIEAPQSIVPGNAMPNMEINDHDARDVAAYLYTLR